ncbi:cytidylyltransferase domain-containing protein [Shewanella atlantica]|uniref:Spore coat protein n=1 Tax=Shewanella atlantica TaxID=271099 RepID=A0A3S0RN58_9GAMM|nr:hypothetical protein [Shewanella atlantica]RTR32533.1 hypothetical protein EKG39_09125 [Shewanella atlantica]
MKVVSCIVARTTSNRLPLKVLRAVNPAHDKSMLDVIISKAKLSTLIDKIYLCTSEEPCDDILVDTAYRNDISLYRGASDAVIERLVSVAEIENADYVVRITGDNIFVAGEYLDEQIELCIDNQLDYCRLSGVPIGATAEVIKVTALKQLYEEMDVSVSEYLMLYIFNPERFRCGILKSSIDLSQYGITVDTPDDFELVKRILCHLGDSASALKLKNICRLFKDNKDIFKEIPADTHIKLPYDESMRFDEFLNNQKQRVERSTCVKQINIL